MKCTYVDFIALPIQLESAALLRAMVGASVSLLKHLLGIAPSTGAESSSRGPDSIHSTSSRASQLPSQPTLTNHHLPLLAVRGWEPNVARLLSRHNLALHQPVFSPRHRSSAAVELRGRQATDQLRHAWILIPRLSKSLPKPTHHSSRTLDRAVARATPDRHRRSTLSAPLSASIRPCSALRRPLAAAHFADISRPPMRPPTS